MEFWKSAEHLDSKMDVGVAWLFVFLENFPPSIFQVSRGLNIQSYLM